MKMYGFKRIALSTVPALLLIACLVSCVRFGSVCGEVRSEVLRLHILANSDSEADQNVKLLVRDALLAKGSELFDGSATVENASDMLKSEYGRLVAEATKVLRENGFDYGAEIRFTNEYFETRTYESVTLPAGNYRAIKVVLGEGEGHNWWCVMFPPLCLPAACDDAAQEVYFDSGEKQLVESSPKYEVRFKIVEIIERIKEKYI